MYSHELQEAERQGRQAHAAMDAWVGRDPDAPDTVPGNVLERYARDLRESRERIRAILSEYGTRDDIEKALAQNEAYHRSLGLSIRDIPDIEDM